MPDPVPANAIPGGPVSAPSALDRDLYCLTCGYNLRGLSGDPIRCPECGQSSTRADLDCPPRMVARRLRHMEVAGFVCFMVLLALGTATALGAHQEGSKALGGMLCGLIPAAMIWGIGCTEFRNACLAERGWQRALILNHLGWLVSVAPGTTGAAALALIARSHPLLASAGELDWSGILILGVVVVACVIGQIWVLARAWRVRRQMLRRLAIAATRYEVEALRRMAQEAPNP